MFAEYSVKPKLRQQLIRNVSTACALRKCISRLLNSSCLGCMTTFIDPGSADIGVQDPRLLFHFSPIPGSCQSTQVPHGLFNQAAPYGVLRGQFPLVQGDLVHVNALVTRSRGDASCFFNGFGEGIRQAWPLIKERLAGNPSYSKGGSSSLSARLQSLVDLPMQAGAMPWRETLSRYAYDRASDFVKHCRIPLSEKERGQLCGKDASWDDDCGIRLVQERAILLLLPATYVDEFHLRILHHYLDHLVDFSAIQEVRTEQGTTEYLHIVGTKITSNEPEALQAMMLHQEYSTQQKGAGAFVEDQRNHFNKVEITGLGRGSEKRIVAFPDELRRAGGPDPAEVAISDSVPRTTVPQTKSPKRWRKPSPTATAPSTLAEPEKSIDLPQRMPSLSTSNTDKFSCKATALTWAFAIDVRFPCAAEGGLTRQCQSSSTKLVTYLRKKCSDLLAVSTRDQDGMQLHAVCCFVEGRDRKRLQSYLNTQFVKPWNEAIPDKFRLDDTAKVSVEPLTLRRLETLCCQASTYHETGTTVLYRRYGLQHMQQVIESQDTAVLPTIAAGDLPVHVSLASLSVVQS